MTERIPSLPPEPDDDPDATRILGADALDEARLLVARFAAEQTAVQPRGQGQLDDQPASLRPATRELDLQLPAPAEDATLSGAAPTLVSARSANAAENAAATVALGAALNATASSIASTTANAPANAPEDAPATTAATANSTTPSSISSLPGQPLPAPDGSTLPVGSANATTSIDASIRQVGRYQVQSRLGRGGMATVYRAHDPSIGRDVAIKFLHASLSEDTECRMRFLREARAAGGLSHSNIVVVHDVGEIENRPYMAMELVVGHTLAEVLAKEKSLPIRQVVLIGLQLARALEYAHGHGVVHRDIKPANIMLLADRENIKVADFGIAHMDDFAATGQRTVVGAVMGTPQYMSPEQTRGDKVDGRSDLFSAGIVMYQMLAGERPFRGESLVATATQIATAEPAPLTTLRPDVPAPLRRVVARCLAKKPEQRYQNGGELAAALIKVLAEIDEAAQERDKPRIVPLRVKWAAAMALLVAVVMGITTAIVTQRQYAALMGQAIDYGSAMARFIAAQNAAAVLGGEEWEPVDLSVQEIMKTGRFERISIVDLSGTVRVSSQAALVGQPYRAPGARIEGGRDGTTVTRYDHQGASVLGFEAPVLFNGKQVGRVGLGIPEAPLTEVARLSLTLMLILLMVTVLAVATAMYFVANWFAKPIRLVRDSMVEIGKGRFNHRIHEVRNDEFGQLFEAFDHMAQALQQRDLSGPAAVDTPQPVDAAAPAKPQDATVP